MDPLDAPRSPRQSTRTLVLTALAALAALAFALLPTSDAEAAGSGRIVNGEGVTQERFDARWRSIAILTTRTERDTRLGQFCAGTFIARDLVATAAHCVSDPFSLLALQEGDRTSRYNNTRATPVTALQVVGGRRVLAVRDGDRVNVSAILIHPGYDPASSRWDVALVQLARPVADSAGVTAISPVAAGEDAATWGGGAGIDADPTRGPWVAGWGWRTDPNAGSGFFAGIKPGLLLRPARPASRPGAAATGRASGRTPANGLREALMPVIGDSRCEEGTPGGAELGYGRDYDAASMLCAGRLDSSDANDLNSVSTGVDSCYGDSGGPMVAATGGALRLVGIVSFGLSCAARDSFGVYTRVASVRSFLGGTPPRRNVENVRAPAAQGRPAPGSVLRCAPGRWVGAGRVRVGVRWVRPVVVGDPAADLLGVGTYERLPQSGTRRTYKVRPRDAGTRVLCLETATNGQTTAAALSKPVRIPGGDSGEDGAPDDMPGAPTAAFSRR
jgi:hypothetical protein